MKKSLLIFTLLISCLGHAQFGGFPHRTKWRQINTDTVRIIYTGAVDEEASRIATLIHKAASDTNTALGNRFRKINIVLHNRTTTANGFVTLAPFHSVFYMIPGSNIYDFGNLSWADQLALHEYRHVQQYNNFRRGLSKGFFYLFGERGLSFANAMAVPDWFFEGDAVHAETALSPQGRGRLSFFLSGYRNLMLDRKKYSWQKLRNGSLKDYVPNHYELGYLLVNYGYEKYGIDFWGKVSSDAAAFRGIFYPFQKAVKKYSGVTYQKFRKEAFEYYRKQMGTMYSDDPEYKRPISFHYFPQYLRNDSLIYLKSSYNRIPAYYVKSGGKEHRVVQQHISTEEWFSARNSQVAYTAYSTHPRWSLIDFSDIVILDLTSGKQRRITHREKYYTPDFSPSGKRILAVRVNDSLKTEIRILNSGDGSIEKRISKAEDDYFVNPRFVDEEKIITGVRTPDARMSLQLYDLSKEEWQELVPSSFHTLSVPSVRNDTVYFTANFYGNDDIYAYDIRNRALFQLTRRYTGSYFPSTNGDSLVFSQFRSDGLRLSFRDLQSGMWARVNMEDLQKLNALYDVSAQHNILDVTTKRFSSKRYSRATGLFNFHSWSPDYIDPEFLFTLYSNNILNTFASQISYRYNQNEHSHGISWNTSYGAFFPMLNAGAEYTFHRDFRNQGYDLILNQFEVRLGYNIPLNFTKKKTYKYLNFGSNIVFNQLYGTGVFKDSVQFDATRYFHHFINWAQYKPMALQHIYPKLGYSVSLAHRHQVGDYGFQAIGLAQVYLPSFKNHSIVLTASAQETDTGNVVFSNRFALSRGYSDYYFSRMWKLAANYHFPIVYPDFGLASIVYFRRIRGNLFYDYSRVFSGDKKNSRNLRSTGGEIFFDTRWWNQQPVSFGFRITHLLDDGFNSFDKKGSTFLEFVIPMNIIPE